MARSGTWTCLVATCLALSAADCRAPAISSTPARVAVPPVLLESLKNYEMSGDSRLEFVSLRPYSRARDLEVLLFSSRSTAFQGVVVPGRFLPLLTPWLTRFREVAVEGVRQDVAKAVGGPLALAVPMTLDFPVLVVRKDLWNKFGLPSPATLAGLRDSALALRSQMKGLSSPIATDLPIDELFWDLGWSFEGVASTVLYSYPKVHTLNFLREFRLDEGADPSIGIGNVLAQGQAAAGFTTLQRGIGLCAADGRLQLLPLPSKSDCALAVYNGWCLAQLASTPKAAVWPAIARN